MRLKPKDQWIAEARLKLPGFRCACIYSVMSGPRMIGIVFSIITDLRKNKILTMMYVHVWNKYLPIIKILMKKSSAGSQTLDLNRIDFERAGSGRKAGYKFTIEFVNGRVSNIISGSALATDLAAVLLNDPAGKAILSNADISISLNTKFQLAIVNKQAAENKDGKDVKALQLHEAPRPSDDTN